MGLFPLTLCNNSRYQISRSPFPPNYPLAGLGRKGFNAFKERTICFSSPWIRPLSDCLVDVQLRWLFSRVADAHFQGSSLRVQQWVSFVGSLMSEDITAFPAYQGLFHQTEPACLRVDVRNPLTQRTPHEGRNTSDIWRNCVSASRSVVWMRRFAESFSIVCFFFYLCPSLHQFTS